MARINLLPWREELRKEQQRQFLTIMGLSAILMVLIIIAVHIQIAGMISYQNSRNDFLNKEIAKVEKQIKEIDNLAKQRKRLLARMEVIETLQRNRPEVVHLFDELVKVMPDGVYLESLTQKGKTLVMEGVAQSNARVSALMRNIDASPWLTNPSLQVIKIEKKSSDSQRRFVLKANQVSNVNEKKK